jgi:hypothetical protein
MADKRPASPTEGAPPANKHSVRSRLELDKADPSQGFHSQTLEEVDPDVLALGQKFKDHVKKAAGLEILMGVTEELRSCVETFKAKGEESISAVKSSLDIIIIKALKTPNGKGSGDEKHKGTKGDKGQARRDRPRRTRSTKAPRARRDQARSNLPWRARRIEPTAELLAPVMFNFRRRVIVVGFPFAASAGILDLLGTRGYPLFLNCDTLCL